MRVGCSLTSSARNDANSEYLRFTSRPYIMSDPMPVHAVFSTYAAIDRVLYIVDPILPRARDQHKLVWVLVKPLFDTRVIACLPRRGSILGLIMLIVVHVAHVPVGDILWRLLCGGRCLGRRSRGTIWNLVLSADHAGDCFRRHMEALRAAGDASPPGPSEVLESWRAKDPYGLLSSSSHMSAIQLLEVE
jgi:hypothetical protein